MNRWRLPCAAAVVEAKTVPDEGWWLPLPGGPQGMLAADMHTSPTHINVPCLEI